MAYGGGHVAALAPVAKILLAHGHDVIFLALTTAKQYLQKHAIPSIGFADLLSFADKNAIALGKKLASGIAPNNAVSMAETVAYLGMSYSDLIAEKGEAEAGKLYEKHHRQCFLPIRSLRAALQYHKPDIVVATNSPRAERAAITAARELSIPAICVVDLFAMKEIEWIGKPGFAERICVFSETVKERFLKAGRMDSEVVVTGNPAFDILLTDYAREQGNKMRMSRGWDDGKTNILWASQVEPEIHPFTDQKGDTQLPYDIESSLRDFVASNDGFRLVVRYHPSQDCDFNPGKNVEFSPVSDEISSILHATDMVITITSTVAVEASIIGRPVITVDKSIFSEVTAYAKMGISVGVDDISQLPGVILQQAQLLNNQSGKNSDKKQDKGKATDKVVEIIESLVKNV